MRLIIGDTETSGLPPRYAAVEIALMEIDADFNILNRWHSLIDPEMEIDPGAQAIHGISAEMVEDAPTSEEFVDHVLGGVLEGQLCLIAHNRRFDQPLLEHIGKITHGLCTLELARLLIRDSRNHKLQTLREYFGIAANEAHRAAGDVETTYAVLRCLVERSGKSLLELVNSVQQYHQVMPYGRFKGKLIMMLPKDYLTHMLGLDGIDIGLRVSMEKSLALK